MTDSLEYVVKILPKKCTRKAHRRELLFFYSLPVSNVSLHFSHICSSISGSML